MNLGICSITRAELIGAVEGLQLAWELGYRRVNVQLDSRCAVEILQRQQDHDHRDSAVSHHFQELMQRDWEVSLTHIYREGNKCADYIASQGHQLPLGYSMFPITDTTLVSWILYDTLGLSEPRLVMNES
ncbi:unnamed protein product [Linum tenue]|uniref:RNase H type-1 domain-containing protein n=1 Tax=Linum tenue TaxID=586396 RepID=A0AAV0HAK7_9ROSI|nr:unnamed protein product [Linum tenue]